MEKPSEHLATYLERIYSFLMSTDQSLVFPSISKSLEDILIDIIKDTNFLKESRFDDCKSLVEKLTGVLVKNKEVFRLDCEFQFDDKKNKVLVYKKIAIASIPDPTSTPLQPLRTSNLIKQKNEDSAPKTVMSSFKITFLNATLKFVKDDSQMVLCYPNMSSEQADFVKQMIDHCMEIDGSKAGFKGLYDSLAEALKIFGLKYEFKLYVGTLGEMKKLRFEKTRKKEDTSKREGTRIICEETNSNSNPKMVTKSKTQKKLSTLIDAISQITPVSKLLILTDLKNFLKDKNISDHTFSNLTSHEQQFISHWQTLAQRVEVLKMLDINGQMVLDDIRECLKKKDFKVTVELGMTTLRIRFAKLTKVYNANKIILTKEEKAARLEAMVLPTMTRKAAGLNSSGNTSTDSNPEPLTKMENKIEKFFNKTKDVNNDWIQATWTQIRNFLQDEAQASLIIPSTTDLQKSFLDKWQSLLIESNVIKAFPNDVQVLMNDIRDAVKANKKKFYVQFGYTRIKNGRRDARFEKQPVFHTPNPTPKENIPVNIQPKNNGNKTEKALDIDKNSTSIPKGNILVKIQPQNREIKTENGMGSIKNEIGNNAMKLAPKNGDKNEIGNNTMKHAPKNGDKNEKSLEKAAVPKNAKSSENIKPNANGNKGEIATQKSSVPKPTCLTVPVKFGPKVGGNKDEIGSNKVAVPKTTICPTKSRLPEPIHKSSSLTSLDQKGSSKTTNKVVRLPVATVKLIEGLNQPVVSEKGSKMMRQMGWAGGPLGARGEGIAEPIKPDLDLGNRAGLGAPKRNIQDLAAASKAHYEDPRNSIVNLADDKIKNDVMQTLWRMVKGDEPLRKDIKFNRKLTMPDWNYIKMVATSFNNREVFPAKMLAVLEQAGDEDLVLTTAWSSTKTDILLILSNYNAEIKIERDKWAFTALAKETLTRSSRKKLAQLSAARDLSKRVMVNGQTFKYYVMEQILDFCLHCNATYSTTKELTKDVILQGTMDQKQRSFITDVVTRLNYYARSSFTSPQDVALHNEIINAMHDKGYKLSVEFPSLTKIDGDPVHKIISLTKNYGSTLQKTVQIPEPPVKTEANQMNNNCITKENKNLQQIVDIIKKDIQEIAKYEHKNSLKNIQDTENKENNIQIINNIDTEVKKPIVSESNAKPNDNNEDKITIDVKNDVIKSNNVIENAQNYENAVKDCCNCNEHNDNDLGCNHNKSGETVRDQIEEITAVDENTSIVEYIILDKHIAGTVSNIKNTDRFKETENNALVTNDTEKLLTVKTEKHVVLTQINKEFHRSLVDEKNTSINDIISSLNDINIAENTKSEKVAETIKDVCSESPSKLNEEKKHTLKRLSKQITTKAISSDRAQKRTKYDYVKHINIQPNNYPQTKMTNNMAAEIQKSIRQSIDFTQVLPLLKCHGIQDGVLSYSCHNEKSFEIIQNAVKPFDLNITFTEGSEKGVCRMSLKLNTFIDESVESIFNNLETFNLSLSTKDWVFIKKEQYSDFIVIYVDMDVDSYELIRAENFKLYAGIDEARFSIVWG